MSYNISHNPQVSPITALTRVDFLKSFYGISDTESRHEDYVDSFTPDATLIMGPKTAKGTDEIRTLRHGLWTHVSSRRHFPERVYFGGDDELMLYGTVKYVLKADLENEVTVPWAGRVVFENQAVSPDGKLRMKFYQVYLDPSAQSGKK
ncbi:hypothetical protein PHISCL_06936 [Aspergillus sclerotialis]|uniref:SnoaL-like domain-containing protein n=1 Tax=Aspergillus sclerotialis TaxID=2070753 RepID=A0A3A2ZUQ3_9EURO|nr:hypothetical protein PHISCL_06936 [Aspergillus sclerotialis]